MTSVPSLAHLATSNRLAVTDKGKQLLLSLRCPLDTGVPALAISALSAYTLTYAPVAFPGNIKRGFEIACRAQETFAN